MEKEQNHLNANEKASAAKAHGYDENADIAAKGLWEKLDSSGLAGVLRLSKRSTLDTPFHEAFHAVWDLVLTAKEKAAMLKHYAPIAKAEGRDVREVMADAYAAWKLKREKLRKGSMFGRLWQKMKDFATRLYAALTGLENANNIMRKIESGEVWERSAEDAAESGKRYAVTNRRISGNTQVPIVDLTDVVPVSKKTITKAQLRKALIDLFVGKVFEFTNIAGKPSVRILDREDAKHLIYSSASGRLNSVRRKALTALEDVFANAFYVEKESDSKHDTQGMYIQMYAAVKVGNDIHRIRVVAKETDASADRFEIGGIEPYDIIKDGSPLTNTPKGALTAASISAGGGGNVSAIPSTISVADLLRGVNDRNGNPFDRR